MSTWPRPRHWGIDASGTLVVEDTATGVAAGIAAGATVYGYSNGGPTSTVPELLLAAGATQVFTSMDKLPALASKQ
ncbi:hypothetical protein [Glutamicibacter sp.]|uniref:hypothetical protein n=1 Tax=Glutamicibacter sp. TaxID=1931995 RepID=UPI003D6A4041